MINGQNTTSTNGSNGTRGRPGVAHAADTISRLEDLVTELMTENEAHAETLRRKREELRQAQTREREANERADTAERRLEVMSQTRQLEITEINSTRIQRLLDMKTKHDRSIKNAENRFHEERDKLRQALARATDQFTISEKREQAVASELERLVQEIGRTIEKHQLGLSEPHEIIGPSPRLTSEVARFTSDHFQPTNPRQPSGVLLLDGDAIAEAGWPDVDLSDARSQLQAALVCFARSGLHRIDILFGAAAGVSCDAQRNRNLRIRVIDPSVDVATCLIALMKQGEREIPLVVVSDRVVSDRRLAPDQFAAALRSSPYVMDAVLEDQIS